MGKKIIATVLILALLCAGGLFAKTEYDKWHAAQPEALKTQVYEDIVRAFPELDRAQVWESPQPLARIEYEVDGYNLLRRPLYKVRSVTGTVSTDITGTEEAGFTVDGRGYDFAQGEAETPLFASYLTSASVSGLFTDLQIVPAEEYDLVRAEDGQLFLTVRDAEDAAAAIRAALSKELVLQRNEEGEQVFSLQMTQPLMLSPDRAVVYARCESGEEEDEAWTTDSCYLLAYDGGSWKLAAEEPDQGAELPYSVEAVYEIPAYVLPPEGRALGHPYYVMVNRQMNTVTVYDGEDAGPFGKPEKAVPEITDENDNGWDPTDPDPDNPWYRGN